SPPKSSRARGSRAPRRGSTRPASATHRITTTPARQYDGALLPGQSPLTVALIAYIPNAPPTGLDGRECSAASKRYGARETYQHPPSRPPSARLLKNVPAERDSRRRRL